MLYICPCRIITYKGKASKDISPCEPLGAVILHTPVCCGSAAHGLFYVQFQYSFKMQNQKNEASNLLPKVFTFNASNQQVRTVLIDNQPYFVAKDVCDTLGHSNPSVAIQMLEEDERAKKSLGRQGETWLVNESGLYNLIFRSNKPEAKAFRKWVTSEVLPSIRQIGKYESGGYLKSNSPRLGHYLDLRNQPYDTQLLNGYPVRVIIHEDMEWFSLADIHRAIQADTCTTQAAHMLNAKRELARKIFIFGNTHPAWFTTHTGLRLIISGSRKLKIENRNFQLCSEIKKGGSHDADK